MLDAKCNSLSFMNSALDVHLSVSLRTVHLSQVPDRGVLTAVLSCADLASEFACDSLALC